MRVYNFFQLLERMYVLKKKEMNEIVTKIIHCEEGVRLLHGKECGRLPFTPQ